ncbi:MAG: response regulator [Solirubrobacterales bacterium]|nr:response regulator [Solirubrobacterales bacterium]
MPLRVLIVDDHETFRRLAARVLMASGFAVVGEAVDAASAIRQAARLRPDVVLLDVMLPDRSGPEVARELVAEPYAPRVVLTSSRSRSDFGRGLPWPGCDFIPKHQLSGASLAALLSDS